MHKSMLKVVGGRGVQQSQVWEAADQILAAGLRPTIERVRMKIGSGSPNTVSPMLDSWYLGLAARLASAGPDGKAQGRGDDVGSSEPAVPAPVLEASQALWAAAQQQAQGMADQQVAERLAALDQRSADLQTLEQALTERERLFEATKSGLEEALATSRKALSQLQAQCEALEGQRAGLEHQAGELRDSLEAVRQQSVAMRRDFDVQISANTAALRDLQARYEANERRLLLEVDRAREEARLASAATFKEAARRKTLAEQLAQVQQAARDAEKAALREHAALAQRLAGIEGEHAQMKLRVDAAEGQFSTASAEIAREVERHDATRALLQQALANRAPADSPAPLKRVRRRTQGRR